MISSSNSPYAELRVQSRSGPIRSKSGITQRVERGTQAISTHRQGPKASRFGAERRQRCKINVFDHGPPLALYAFFTFCTVLIFGFYSNFTRGLSVVVSRVEATKMTTFLVTRPSTRGGRWQNRHILASLQRRESSESFEFLYITGNCTFRPS